VTRHPVIRAVGALLALALSACPAPTESSVGVNIRVANESSFAFSDVDVVFPQDSVDYGTVPAHGASEYRRVTQAYSYALIIVQVGGEELRLQPVDYVGEAALAAGRYTYALNLTIEGHLTLEFRRD
jgi:hypothetical protein